MDIYHISSQETLGRLQIKHTNAHTHIQINIYIYLSLYIYISGGQKKMSRTLRVNNFATNLYIAMKLHTSQKKKKMLLT